MAIVKFTRALRRFYPDLKPLQIDAVSIAEVLAEINRQHPGLADYIVDERGKLRQHVNIFINNSLINDREALSDTVAAHEEVYIMQALSGG